MVSDRRRQGPAGFAWATLGLSAAVLPSGAAVGALTDETTAAPA